MSKRIGCSGHSVFKGPMFLSRALSEFRISNGKFAVGVSDRISKPVFFDGVQFGKCQDALSCGNVGGH